MSIPESEAGFKPDRGRPAAAPQLNQRQLEAVRHPGGPLLIAAGAGSGKTRTLTSRVLHLLDSGVPPEQILAITFTNKAASEMRNRITGSPRATAGSPLFIGTFHSLGARILKREARSLGRTASFTIYDDDDSLTLIKKTVADLNLDREQYHPLMFRTVISRVKNELEEAPSQKISRLVFERYEQALEENNAFDFDDLIQKTVLLFQNEPALLQQYQRRWRHILVDEFQDVNTGQYQLVKLLAREHQNLAVVGDDFQSIFGFRGADYRNFLNFEKDWPSATVVLLEENYRSAANIIAAANAVIARNKNQKPKTLWTGNPAGEPIRVTGAADENEEAETAVKEIIAGRRRGIPLEDIAVLYRTNAQSRAVEQNLIAAGIAYRIFGGIRFYDRKEIKDIVAALRLAHNPQDSVSAERLTKNLPKRTAAALIQELPRLGKELTAPELINYFLNETEYIPHMEKREKNHEERLDNINELIAFAAAFTGEDSLTDFLEKTALYSSLDNPDIQKSSRHSAVQLLSIHLAKGLEFHTVFVIGCSEGTLPHHRSYDEPGGVEEERRLMYVAITRAKQQLRLSFTNLASRFLYEIPPELVEFTAPRTQKISSDKEEEWIEYG